MFFKPLLSPGVSHEAQIVQRRFPQKNRTSSVGHNENVTKIHWLMQGIMEFGDILFCEHFCFDPFLCGAQRE